MKKKKTVLDVQLPLTKKLATTQDRQILQNSDEKQDCQIWILYVWLFLPDFAQTEIAC